MVRATSLTESCCFFVDPLKVVDHFGDVEIWPTYIVIRMFVPEPSHRSNKDVAAFMYVNNTPIGIAVECFNACNIMKCSVVEAAM